MDEDNITKFTKNDNIGRWLIVQCVADSQLEYLREKNTAYQMWSILEDRYEKKVLQDNYFLKKNIIMKLKEGWILNRNVNYSV